jgi:hypothetical protein
VDPCGGKTGEKCTVTVILLVQTDGRVLIYTGIVIEFDDDLMIVFWER